MNVAVKVLLSIVLFIIGLLCAGLFPGLLGAFLFIASIIGIVTIWKKRKIEGEGNIFKNQDKLNKD
tara:strand:+ start:426 stop:623 length:198 start_codon:yes stop_codon:yes gene_type:complete